jgi:hypothetical protein
MDGDVIEEIDDAIRRLQDNHKNMKNIQLIFDELE